eukprot:TRINITY_DN11263_c0_g1_i6.p1 TRINITY_DN11263_c0_g1~~TRINITY_DN11263_c0_g1_i6.p1  ORF type:complete len:210 (+),score=24.68 TRINITY_DN11263_c0_g1_i6:201-830(+)
MKNIKTANNVCKKRVESSEDGDEAMHAKDSGSKEAAEDSKTPSITLTGLELSREGCNFDSVQSMQSSYSKVLAQIDKDVLAKKAQRLITKYTPFIKKLTNDPELIKLYKELEDNMEYLIEINSLLGNRVIKGAKYENAMMKAKNTIKAMDTYKVRFAVTMEKIFWNSYKEDMSDLMIWLFKKHDLVMLNLSNQSYIIVKYLKALVDITA